MLKIVQDEEPKEEGEKNPEGYIDIPEDEPIDLEAEDELFNTAFVEALSEIKLAVIPDDITYDDDPFNTGKKILSNPIFSPKNRSHGHKFLLNSRFRRWNSQER